MLLGKPPEDPAQVEAWSRTYVEHGRDPANPRRCAVPACGGRFPCAARVEAAELLVLAGVGVPDVPEHD